MLASQDVPYQVVRLLVERDRLDVLRIEADKGDWNCGDALGEELLRRGETEGALAVYRSFVRSDWDAASYRVAEILETVHGVDAAIAFVQPYADAGARNAVHALALLLGRQGRTDEVFTLLEPYLTEWYLVSALVEATAGGDRDERVIAVLEDLVEAVERQPDRWRAEPHNAAQLLATVFERQGRLGEAVDLLRRVRVRSVNEVEQLADLIAKDGRESELRDLVAGEGREHAAYRLAGLLEKHGRVAEAIAALRPFVDEGNPYAAAVVADLLRRHGRIDEATDVLYAAVRSEGASHNCTRVHLWTMLMEAGRPDDALRLLDELERDFDVEDLFHDRISLLQECGRDEEALALLRAYPKAGEEYWLSWQAGFMAHVGSLDEAIALLRPYATSHFVGEDLAALLIRRGQVDEAMAVVHGREPLDLGPDPFAGIGTTSTAGLG